MNRDIEGRTFELRAGNVRADRFRQETATGDARVVVTVVRVTTAVPDGRVYGTAHLLVLDDTSRFGFPSSLPLQEMNELELWKEL